MQFCILGAVSLRELDIDILIIKAMDFVAFKSGVLVVYGLVCRVKSIGGAEWGFCFQISGQTCWSFARLATKSRCP
ncbi:hypothetical protein SMACR_07633 [Sordaria macrospora]|uniref:WGS project CABT00000000 data, contig 2.31 n=2 Tax=Sordaria macrospora TaxID=5147 RepID=F7W5K0_SORMK|nr:uncharacterized protein SMAC_07633 [Sordaria macrospora k-hell]KAA8633962.1 hypothetical protein SMACR_07633 [Sordaria macrospora]WPJ66208.1 hypothetical protein SMAC4_07633 [Sordaria macrospora]CCC12788.1 unnamed protein product [Sordaria macrospora k-hell]